MLKRIMRGRETKKDGGAGKRWREVQGGREIHGEGKNYREGEGQGGRGGAHGTEGPPHTQV